MISKSLSTSERFAALHKTAGKLAEFCQSLYPLLVAHADDWGCLPGDVFTVKHLVNPTSPRKPPEFHNALVALHNVKLITWYQVPDDDDSEHAGKRVIHIRGWFAHQQLKGHDRDGRKRTYPEPPENPNVLEDFAQKCPKVPKSALREEKRTEENLTYMVAADATTAESDSDLDTNYITSQHVSAFLRRFCELYSKYRHGAKYTVIRTKHVPNVRLLLSVYDAPRLEKLSVVLLTTDDQWIAQTDRGIGILLTKASWLDGLLAGYEASHGPIQVAS